jgi:hypothetical protein
MEMSIRKAPEGKLRWPGRAGSIDVEKLHRSCPTNFHLAMSGCIKGATSYTTSVHFQRATVSKIRWKCSRTTGDHLCMCIRRWRGRKSLRSDKHCRPCNTFGCCARRVAEIRGKYPTALIVAACILQTPAREAAETRLGPARGRPERPKSE